MRPRPDGYLPAVWSLGLGFGDATGCVCVYKRFLKGLGFMLRFRTFGFDLIVRVWLLGS